MITVDKAITRGQLTVNIPVFIILFGCIGLSFYLAASNVIPFYFGPTSLVLGPAVAWIYWSFAITRWRIWAFSNVDDVHELKSRAILGQLIWPDGSFFERTEIRTSKQRKLINEIKKRFQEPTNEKFADDPTIPPVTRVFYSKVILINILLMAGCLVYGIFLLVRTDNWVMGVILILAGAYFTRNDFKKFSTFKPLIILDEKGIEIMKNRYPWNEVQHFEVIIDGFGKHRTVYLILETTNEIVKQSVDEYNITFKKLRHIINVYRGRFSRNNDRISPR